MKFNQVLVELMKQRKISNAQVARQTGISKARISGFVGGKFLPSCMNLLKLADFFGVSIDYLVGLDENPEFGIYSKAAFDNFVKNYVWLLKQRKISNRKFSALIGINKSNLFLWQNGTLPHTATLIAMSKEFGISIDKILERRKIDE